MTHKTVKDAIQQSDELERLRSGEEMSPPPNYDIVFTLYERNSDGTDADEGFLYVGFRPQDFAVNEFMKYQRFGVLKHHKRDDEEYVTCWLIHLYWDGSRDDDSARDVVLSNSYLWGYGEWMPTAPSDPLSVDDFWDLETLGEPPNGYWEDRFDLPDEGSVFFDNFEREPYKKMQFGRSEG